MVGHVHGEVVVRVVRRLDRVGVLEQARLVLRGFARDETVEVAKTQAGGILVVGAARFDVAGRGVVPFAKSGAVVAIFG